MMRSKIWAISGVCAMALVGIDLATSRAQYSADFFSESNSRMEESQPGSRAVERPPTGIPGGAPGNNYAPGQNYSSFSNDPLGNPGTPYPTRAMVEIEATGRAFRDATSEEAKSKTRKKLVELLEKYFDDDLKIRATELEKVEARVKKLRTLLDKRASKKQEIVDLQVKVLENEADGLGFFNSTPTQAIHPPFSGMQMPPGGVDGRFVPTGPFEDFAGDVDPETGRGGRGRMAAPVDPNTPGQPQSQPPLEPTRR